MGRPSSYTQALAEEIVSRLSAGEPLAQIYGLYDASGALRYIGKANDPAARLRSHMRDSRSRRTPVYDWIRKHGQPEMRILEADCADWRESERRLIAEARERGDKLLNVADGGEEPFCTPEQRVANGRRLNAHILESGKVRYSLSSDRARMLQADGQARISDDPNAQRLKESKRRLTSAWKDGRLSAFALECMRECYRFDAKTFRAWATV